MISARTGRRGLVTHLAQETGVGLWRAASLARVIERAVREQLQRQQRRETPTSEGLPELLAWARAYLPQHFSLPPSAMHRWLARQLPLRGEERGVKINCIGPRGHAKSTVATLAYVLRAAVEGWEPYIWIVSDTRTQAATHLEHIKSELMHNAALGEDYPEATGRGPRWRCDQLVLRNGVTIEAYGTGQHLRGRRRREARPTLIVADDLQSERHIESARGREQSRRWFYGTLLKAGTRRTNLVHLATALHREALAIELTRTPGWRVGQFPAIVHWPERMDLWQAWETLYTSQDDPLREQRAAEFYRAHRVSMHQGAEVQWPEQEDLYTLMRMRVEGGRATFEREKQGVPHDPAQCEWPEEYFGRGLWFNDWPAAGLRVMAIDPSKGTDARHGDYSAIVRLAVDPAGVCHVDADLARRPTSQLVADGVAAFLEFQPQAMAIEANQYQELLAGEFTAEFRRQGRTTVGLWLLANQVNKRVRIRRLGPLLAERRLRFRAASAGARLLVDQLRDFPCGDHDDGPDALEMALRLAAQLQDEATVDDGLGERLVAGP
ncbi:MAG: hypothetical protein K1X74_00610 [Pirellulales bacterium]|nr:hypothetical protein [Pirellulales bacterium]